ncbi:MAG: hypothetical protein VW808_07710, partial [Schleiferiaceae bacterium]
MFLLLLIGSTGLSAQSCNYPITLSSSGVCSGDSVYASTNSNSTATYTWSLNGTVIASGASS